MVKLIPKLALLLLTLASTLEARIEQYFQKIEGKPDHHSIKNVDFIYMINLDERPEKFERAAAILATYNIHPYRFSAVNGWKLPLSTINDLGVKFAKGMNTGFLASAYLPEDSFKRTDEMIHVEGRTYFAHDLSRGAIGAALSHLSILQDAYDSGYETIWVMEDDIAIAQDPRIISDLIEALDNRVGSKNWDILFTDKNTQNPNGDYIPYYGFDHRPNFTPKNSKKLKKVKTIDKNFRKVGARYGAYSMILRRSGIKKILNFLKIHDLFLHYDREYFQPEDIQLYTVTKDVVRHQNHSVSDSSNGSTLTPH